MTNYLVVIPYTNADYLQECLQTLKIPRENIMVVDNTEDNRGVAGSWNLGIAEMKRRNAEWLIIVSAAMRFGHKGGFDMIAAIEHNYTDDIIRFAQRSTPELLFDGSNKFNNPPYPECFYWHCTAVNRSVFNQVGKFDENFYPIYFEDTDYDLRINKAGFKSTDIIAPIDANTKGAGHGVVMGHVKTDPTASIAYFATKWGRHPGAAELGSYDRPFNDKENSLAFWPPANGGKYDD